MLDRKFLALIHVVVYFFRYLYYPERNLGFLLTFLLPACSRLDLVEIALLSKPPPLID